MGKFRKAVRESLILGLWLIVVGLLGLNYWLSFDRYFDVGKVLVPNEVDRIGFDFAATGRALTTFNGSYRVLLRDFATNVVVKQYPDSGAFEYSPTILDTGEIVSGYPNPVAFDWWVGQQGELEVLPTGLFYIQTCWTVHDRFGGLYPQVSGCVDSNAFHVN